VFEGNIPLDIFLNMKQPSRKSNWPPTVMELEVFFVDETTHTKGALMILQNHGPPGPNAIFVHDTDGLLISPECGKQVERILP